MEPSNSQPSRPSSGVPRQLGHDPRKRLMTLGDLLASDLVGMWADREDIEDSAAFARALREKHQQRDGATT